MISLFKRLKLRLKDMATISKLCQVAETYAQKRSEGAPAEEHFLLSALDLPDGTARRVFERVGASPEQLEKAIDQQHNEALSYIGVDISKLNIDDSTVDSAVSPSIPFESKPSAQSLMKELVKMRRNDKDIPLIGLHIIEVLSSKELGVVARTMKLIGISQDSLKEAVAKELECYKLSM